MNEPAAVVAAWLEYLMTTRGVDVDDYQAVEAWAWERLQDRLARFLERQLVAA